MSRLLIAGASYAEPGSPLVAAIAAALPGFTVTAAGLRGRSLGRWLPEFSARADLRGADVLIVELGGNGVASVADIHDAEATIRALGARSVRWTLPPTWPVSGTIARRRAEARANIEAANVTTVRGGAIEASDVAGDGAHLTRSGYASWGHTLGEAWRRAGGTLGLFAVLLALALAVSL